MNLLKVKNPVIPAKAGIQYFQMVLDYGFRWNDENNEIPTFYRIVIFQISESFLT